LPSSLPVHSSRKIRPAAGTVIKNVSPDEAEKALKEQKNVVVLDVRTPEEFKAGHIAGAKNVDFKAPDFCEAGQCARQEQDLYCALWFGPSQHKFARGFKEQKFPVHPPPRQRIQSVGNGGQAG
jgi:hypothetical protein